MNGEDVWYNGRKKCHCFNNIVVVDIVSGQFIFVKAGFVGKLALMSLHARSMEIASSIHQARGTT